MSERLSDARLLFAAFATSPWTNLELVCGPLTLSVSRAPAAERAPTAPLPPASDPSDVIVLRAPHVGDLRQVGSPGALVCAGDAYAYLGLLDEVQPLLADHDLEIVASLLPVGSLVEFAMPIAHARRR